MSTLNAIKNSLLVVVATFAINKMTLAEESAPPRNLDELLQKIKSDHLKDSEQNKNRERQFLQALSSQGNKVDAAKKELRELKSIESRLKAEFEANEKKLTKLDEKLKITMGILGELFGIVRQVAGDTKGQFENSIITSQFPERLSFIEDIASRKSLPDSEDLERLWIELLNEMVESGKITQFTGEVIGLNGESTSNRVTRVGSFNLISQDKYLKYDHTNLKSYELGRQPPYRYRSMADTFTSSPNEILPLAIDPSRGAILAALIQSPTLVERFQQGGIVGYVIACLLFAGIFITVRKIVFLTALDKKIKLQVNTREIDPKNPLGSILETYEKHKDHGTENLEIALEEAIFKSTKKIEKGIKLIKILAAIAPMLGLLGTVTGMIGTFQSMMLFGSGDPKLMAGGISQALVTTVLGLIAAIPLILLHSFVSSKSREITEILEEQSIGLFTKHAETKIV